MSVPGYEEWALNEMEELGMNEIEYCNYKGCNICDILEEPRDDDDEGDSVDF